MNTFVPIIIIIQDLPCRHIPLECARPHTGKERNPRLVLRGGISQRPAPLGTGAAGAAGSAAPARPRGRPTAAPTASATAPAPRPCCAPQPAPACSGAAPTTTKAIPVPSQHKHCHKHYNPQNTHLITMRNYDEIDMICNKNNQLLTSCIADVSKLKRNYETIGDLVT